MYGIIRLTSYVHILLVQTHPYTNYAAPKYSVMSRVISPQYKSNGDYCAKWHVIYHYNIQ